MFFPLRDNLSARRIPLVTYVLMTISVLAFFWVSRLPTLPQEVWAYQHGFVPARISQLSNPRPMYVPVNVPVCDPFRGEYYEQRSLKLAADPKQIAASLLTCMFLHATWIHLVTNMWFLWLFGYAVEDRLGQALFLFLYLCGGVVASLTHWALTPNSITPLIGASGAIAGVLGAYAVTWPLARISTFIFLVAFFTVVDVPAMVVLGVWFVAQVMAGQALANHAVAGGVAWWAHVGGFLAGMTLMPLLCLLFGGRGDNRREESPAVDNKKLLVATS